MDDAFYLKAFWILNSCRNYENGPVPWNRILEYGIYHKLDYDLLEIFHKIIERLDLAYLDWLAKEQEKTRKRQKQNNSQAKSRISK